MLNNYIKSKWKGKNEMCDYESADKFLPQCFLLCNDLQKTIHKYLSSERQW